MNSYIVYKHILPNKKAYIGITKYSIDVRSGLKGQRYKKSAKFFYSAIQKYGWSNIEHKVLIHGLTKEQACNWEIKLIKFYKTSDKRFGYNIHSGGTNNIPYTKQPKPKTNFKGENNPMYGRKHSALTKEKIGEKSKQRWKELKHPMKGKHWDDATKERIRQGNMLHSPKRKQVLCVETNTLYTSAREAARQLNIDNTIISRCCRNKCTYKKLSLTFRYV